MTKIISAPTDALYPCVGIVVEILLLIIIIFLCEKRRFKKERQELETETQEK